MNEDIKLLRARLDNAMVLIECNHNLIKILVERIQVDEDYFKKMLELRK